MIDARPLGGWMLIGVGAGLAAAPTARLFGMHRMFVTGPSQEGKIAMGGSLLAGALASVVGVILSKRKPFA